MGCFLWLFYEVGLEGRTQRSHAKVTT